jgi:16S rRNA (guanine1207-N2)-methyltransferase
MSRDFARHQALECMMLALEGQNLVPDKGRIAFLRARPHANLQALGKRLFCQQDYKPQAAELDQAGFQCVEELEGKFPLVLLLPNRQREETQADMARAFDLLEDGGTLVMSMHNDWGAKRYEKMLAEFAGEAGTLSKHHCRTFWAVKSDIIDVEMWDEWRRQGALQRVIEDRFWSKPGLFSWNEVDPGSQLLVDHLPKDITGRVADLGASWGFLSDFVLRNHPDLLSLDCFEADRSAVECLRRNLGSIASHCRPNLHWEDVTQGVGENRFDWVVMNPPFHEGRNADPLLGAKFIAAAARSLRKGGQLWMVANRHLPYEHLLEEAFQEYRCVVQTSAFKVLSAVR